MSKVVHFELPANNPEELMKFFGTVFGWTFNNWDGQEYWLTDAGEGVGIGGAITKRRDADETVVNAIGVADIDKAADSVTANGGEIISPKIAVPGMGYVRYFKDPEGNMHSMWQPDMNAA